MKKLIGLVAFLALSFILPARAETVKVFTWYVGQVQSGQAGWSDVVKPFYLDEEPDFGCISGPKSDTYYSGSAAGKVTSYAYVAQGKNGILGYFRFLVYRSDRYSLAAEYPAVIPSTGKRYVVSGCVLESVAVPDTYCALIYVSSEATNFEKVGGLVDSISKSYSDVKFFVIHGRGSNCVTETAELELAAYLTGTLKMTKIADGTSAAIYSSISPTSATSNDLTAFTAGDDSTIGLAGTFTYPSRCSVIFKDYDGTVLGSEVVNEGGSVTPPTPPERPGFEFVGWDHDDAEFANVVESFTATAQYETAGNSHLVTYLGWSETMVDERAVEDGEKAEAIACPERAGYESLGWFKDGEPYDFNLPVTDDIVLVATYRLFSRYEVGTVEELVNVLSIGLEPSVVCALTNDLDLAGSGYVASDFGAILEGNGHSIVGFSDNMSLFKTVTGTIRNLCIRNVDIKMSDYERGILGSQAVGARIENVTFENCKITGARTNAGFGLFFASTTSGELDVSTVISNCVARNCHALITSSGIQGIRCGGFVSNAGGQTHIVDCLFLSDNPDEVTVGGAGAMGAGSFACESVGTGMIIERCLSEGKVYAPRCYGNSSGAGGIVGGASGLCRVYDCTNRATVVGALQNGNGGIVGRGCKAPVRIYRSVNYGSVTTDPYSTGTNPVAIGAGGILGGCWGGNAGVTIVDCANFGVVSTTTNNVPAGGVIGSLSGQATCVSNCMNYASVFAPTNAAGGVIGNAVSSSFSIYNTGNAGDVSCPLGSAGGVIGKNEFLNNNVHDYVYGFMQCGTVSTDSGYAGEIVGLRVGAQNTGCSLAVKNGVLAGSVVAGDGGRTGLLVAGTSPLGTGGEVTYSVDEATHVLDTTLVHYYNKSDEPCSFADPLTEMSAVDLTRKNGATKWLNDYAAEKAYMRWVRGKSCPELALWGEPFNSGLMLIFR